LAQVVVEVADGVVVALDRVGLAVDDEHDAVDVPEHHLARGVLSDLPGNRDEMKTDGVATKLAELKWQEVEEERALGLGVHRDELASELRPRLGVDDLEVGALAAKTDAVVDELERDFALRVVNQRHNLELPGSRETVKKPANGDWTLIRRLRGRPRCVPNAPRPHGPLRARGQIDRDRPR